MYKVVAMFHDLQDERHLYRTGDTFPRDGLEVSAERIAELSTDRNRMHRALIAKVEEKKSPRKRVKKDAE